MNYSLYIQSPSPAGIDGYFLANHLPVPRHIRTDRVETVSQVLDLFSDSDFFADPSCCYTCDDEVTENVKLLLQFNTPEDVMNLPKTHPEFFI